MLKIISYFAALSFPLFCVLSANQLAFRDIEKLTVLIYDNFYAFLFGVIISYAIFFPLCMIFKKLYIPAFIMGTFFYLIGVAEYLKFSILNEHLLPWDISLAKNLGSFSTFLNGMEVGRQMVFIFAVMLIYVLLFFISDAKANFSWKIRIPCAVLSFMFLMYFVGNADFRANHYHRFNLILTDMIDQNINYENNGLVSAFFLNLGSMNIKTPGEYNQSAIESLINQYGNSLSADFKSPDVIVILSEAYWDITTLEGLKFSSDPLENFRKIQAQDPSFHMVSNAFGGNTIRPEFEVLTGMAIDIMPTGALPYQQYIKDESWSFAKLYKDLGYNTLGIHTYKSSFYDRSAAYPHLGFDEFYGQDSLHVDTSLNKGGYLSDDVFVNEIIYQLENKSDKPLFIFGISMENHGLYLNKYDQADIDIKVTDETSLLSEDEMNCVLNFSQGVKNADRALGNLYDYVMQRDEPTVVLVFGDHLPAIGQGYSIYSKLNNINEEGLSSWDMQQKLYMFSTPSFIFSNYDTGKEADFAGKHISTYHLINLLSDYIGAPKTPFMNLLFELYNECPVYNKTHGLFYGDYESETAKKLVESQKLFSYDMIAGQKYSLK